MTSQATKIMFAALIWAVSVLPAHAVSQDCPAPSGPTLMRAVTGLQAELAKPDTQRSEVSILNHRAEIASLNGNAAAFRLWAMRLAQHPEFQQLPDQDRRAREFDLATLGADLEPTGSAFLSAAALATSPQDRLFWTGRAAAASGDASSVERAVDSLDDPLKRGLVLADAGTYMGDLKLAERAVQTLEPLLDQLSWRCEPDRLGDAVLGLVQAELALGRTDHGIQSIKLAMRAFDAHLYPEQWARASRKLKRLMAKACRDGDAAACSFRQYFKMIGLD